MLFESLKFKFGVSYWRIMELQDIVECVVVEDVFFDCLEDTSSVNEVLKYEIWRNELRSVEERRGAFLSEMGFIDSSSLSGFGLSLCSTSSIECGDDNVVFSEGKNDGDGNLVVHEQECDLPIREETTICDDDNEPSTSSGSSFNKRIGHWWKHMSRKRKEMSKKCKCESENEKYKNLEMSRTKVHVNKKRVKELSALFEVQEIQAHKGIIWSMKFSPDGQYLASGGQDGVVRVWRVKYIDSCCDSIPNESITPEKKVTIPVVVPDKRFQIEEHPLHEFHGHSGDVLDIAWSPSNYLLSSSTDKTVRLWHVGSNACLSTFLHTDYVTCVQFNPMDNSCFISGSIDGKVRVWGVTKRRVLDWADVGDVVTAVCYQPDGHGFVVGSLSGFCRFYERKGVGHLVELSEHIPIHSSNRTSTYRITGIQFVPEDSQKVMVMTEDSKLRILDKEGFVCKYRGLPKSGGQVSASFSSTGSHIVSVGDNSNVYVWNQEERHLSSSRLNKSNRSCEYFRSDNVSVAISWSETMSSDRCTSEHEAPPTIPSLLDFSFSSLFSSKGSAIWPEDILPIINVPQEEIDVPTFSSAWGLVIVTASCDGIIRVFHNYGLPIKV